MGFVGNKLKTKNGQFKSVPPPPDFFGRYVSPKLPETVMVISDLQAPYHHPQALTFLEAVAQKYKPDTVVSIGDELDLNFLSKYDHYPEIDNPQGELDQALEFTVKLFKAFPKALALTSNHVQGRLATARRAGRLPPQMLTPWENLVNAPKGWCWYEEVHLGHVLFRHGDQWSKLNKPELLERIPRNYGRTMSVVHGHLHSEHGVVASVLVGEEEYWAAYTGCLCDLRSKAFAYVKAPKIRLGCLVVKDGYPLRIPFRRNEVGRWAGIL